MTFICHPHFAPGQIVRHKIHGYRGLIFDVDGRFAESPEWLEKLEATHPVDDMPWYHVLVDGETHTTYVAEENLELATGVDTLVEFDHPLLADFFRQMGSEGLSARHIIN